MANTPNYNLHYPVASDRPAAFPAAQKTSQETIDTLLKQISDGYPAGDASTLSAARSYAETQAANALSSANTHTNARTPQVTVNTSVGTRVIVGGVMVYGDTGWRDVSGNVADTRTVGGIRTRRVNDKIRVAIRSMSESDSNSWLVLNHAVGWRPTTSGMIVTSPRGTTDTSTITWTLYLSSIQCRPEIATTGTAWIHFEYETSDSWPSSLPGTPA